VQLALAEPRGPVHLDLPADVANKPALPLRASPSPPSPPFPDNGELDRAAAMIRAGASPKARQAILGHQSAGFTLSVYGHVFDQDMTELAQRLEKVTNVRMGPEPPGPS